MLIGLVWSCVLWSLIDRAQSSQKLVGLQAFVKQKVGLFGSRACSLADVVRSHFGDVFRQTINLDGIECDQEGTENQPLCSSTHFLKQLVHPWL